MKDSKFDPRDEPRSFNPVEHADERRRAREDAEYWEAVAEADREARRFPYGFDPRKQPCVVCGEPQPFPQTGYAVCPTGSHLLREYRKVGE